MAQCEMNLLFKINKFMCLFDCDLFNLSPWYCNNNSN